MARSKTAAQRLNAAGRVAKIWELRKCGLSYEQIAQRLKISKGTVSKDLTKALAELHAANVEGVAEVRALELERLDVALAAIWGKVKRGALGAIDRLVRIQERRAKLLGLDAPTRAEITEPDGEDANADIARRIIEDAGASALAHELLERIANNPGGPGLLPRERPMDTGEAPPPPLPEAR